MYLSFCSLSLCVARCVLYLNNVIYIQLYLNTILLNTSDSIIPIGSTCHSKLSELSQKQCFPDVPFTWVCNYQVQNRSWSSQMGSAGSFFHLVSGQMVLKSCSTGTLPGLNAKYTRAVAESSGMSPVFLSQKLWASPVSDIPIYLLISARTGLLM